MAIAWFEPLPPSGETSQLRLLTVSPGAGNRSTRMTWPTPWLPATTTSGAFVITSTNYQVSGGAAVFLSVTMMTSGTTPVNSVAGYSTVGSLNVSTRMAVRFH